MSHYLKRTPTSTGSRTKGTWSFWIKRNIFNGSSTSTYLFYAAAANQGADVLRFNDDDGGDSLRALFWDETNQLNGGFINYDKLRDSSAWMHVLLVYDSALNTGDNMTNNDQTLERMKIFVNGRRMIETGGNSAQNPGVPANNLMTNWGNKGIINTLFANTTGGNKTKLQAFDHFFVDGQALTPDVFAYSREGDGYYSSGHKYSTDFRPGQWSPHLPRKVITEIERRGGFGVNGYYLPMNDSSNPGTDFHCTPNSIIKLKGEDLMQPRGGAPTTSDAYISELREEPATLGFDGCIKLDGNDGIDVAANSALDLGTGDFTIEGFYYLKDQGTYHSLFDGRGSGGDGLYPSLFKDTSIDKLYFYANSGVRIDNIPMRYNEWMHVAICRSSGTTRAFVDGKLAGSFSDTHDYICRNLLIGQSNNNSNDLYGFVSNFRIVKGTALYTSNFTRPTSPLENVSNTILLCANSSTSATASTVTPSTITAIGDAFATKNELTGSIILAVPGISTATGSNLITNGGFDNDLSGWTTVQATTSWKDGYLRIVPNVAVNGAVYQSFTTVIGQRYSVSVDVVGADPISVPPSPYARINVGTTTDITLAERYLHTGQTALHNVSRGRHRTSFTATTTTTTLWLEVGGGNQTQVDFDNVVVKQENVPRDYSADIRGSGSTLSLTAYGNAGIAHNFPSHYGSAINFGSAAGAEDYFTCTTPVLGDGDWTVEEWIRQSPGASLQSYWNASIGVNGDSNSQNAVTIYHPNNAGSGTDGEVSFIAANNGYRIYGYQDLRDDAWHHIVVEKHNDVVTLYVDGVAKSSSPDTYNYDSTSSTYIGASKISQTNFFPGQIVDIRVYAGVAKYKGGFDVSKPFTILHGDLGPGIESWRTTPDTVTNNFATWNVLDPEGKDNTFSDGNLKVVLAYQGDAEESGATLAFSSGKWYWEEYMQTSTDNSGNVGVGVKSVDGHGNNGGNHWRVRGNGGETDHNGTQTNISGFSWTNGDIIGIAVDMDAGTWTVSKNGTFIGSDIHTNLSGIVTPTMHNSNGGENHTFITNFGQNPTFCGTLTAGTNTDSNGKGLFKYLPPSGFLALCTDNLPTPAIADPGKHFKTVLWSGDGVWGRRVDGVGFKPDLVWLKPRNYQDNHVIFNSIINYAQYTNSATAGNTTHKILDYGKSGFTLTDWNNANDPGDSYVAWCWKAGGAPVVNNDGSVTSTVSANPEAGFSMVRFTAQTTANDITVGHGLGKKPAFWIYKPYTNSTDWYCYHQSLGASAWINFDNQNATFSNAAAWGTEPTDTVLTHGQGLANQGDCMMFVWAEIEGYSRFGSYLGNQDDNGPFVYCGFRPAYVMLKIVTGEARDWHIYDSSRNPVNPVGLNLRPSGNDAENDEPGLDFLSNGFKIRKDWLFSNDEGSRIIFAAFAESPFKTANAK